jgi:hypothetical protein
VHRRRAPPCLNVWLTVWLSGLFGLFFAIVETDANNYFWNQFESLDPAPMLLGFQTEFEDHRQGCDP